MLLNLFAAISNDVAYIGLRKPNKTVIADGTSKTIAVALSNKTISGIGYYPSNLQLIGTITLTGDNSEFNEKSFIVADGTKSTIITLTNPIALPQTDTTVEANGRLVLSSTENYTLSHNLTIKSGGYLQALKRFATANGSLLTFEA